MYCIKCGKLVDDDSKFCLSCGNRIKIEDSSIDDKINNSEFIFSRHKSLGRIDISHTISKINISNKILNINQQKINFYWFKKQPIETSHELSTITKIKVKKTVDISDLIFAILFILLGFVNPLNFLVSAILLWLGFGYKVIISKINGTYIEIPAEFSKDCMNLVQDIVKHNNSVLVEQ